MENLAISFFERIKEQVTLRTIKYCILMAGFLCVCVPSLYGVENLNVTGKVVDSSGEPLIGVSIKVENKNMGTTTDINGNFTLADIPKNTVLVLTYIGMETQKVTVTQNRLNIVMRENSVQLEEVVAIGYGTVKKEELTSAVTKVGEESFNAGVTTSPINLLNGKVPGLSIRNTSGNDPNASPEIHLRGIGSIRAGSAPLIIVDGTYSTMSELQAINANDIKSFNVLKDGSSAAIYGTRGSNGVIIVETKNASKGKASIEYTSYYYTERPVRKLEMMSADEYMGYLKDKGHSTINNDYGFSTDWTDQLIRNNFSYYQGVSFSTGTEISSIRGSVGYRDSESMVINTGNKQLTGRVNFKQYFFDKKLTIEGTLNGANTQSDYTDYGAFMQAIVYHPTAPVYNQEGKFFEYAGVGPYNPVALLSQVDNRGERYTYSGNLSANLKVLPCLSVYAMMSANNDTYEGSKYISRDSRYSVLGGFEGQADMNTYFYKKRTFEAYANYSFSTDVHNLTALAGYSFNREDRTWHNASNSGFLTDIPGANNIGNGTYLEDGLASMGRGQDESKLIAFFGRINYSYKGKYLFNASVRREGSTRFGENHKWGWFPAVSAGWRILEENFFSDATPLSNLKLRVGFGITGNQDIPLYASIAKYNDLGYAYYNGKWDKVYGPVSNPNPDLKWEKNAEYNAGVDFGIWNDRLTASVDYYYRKTTDLLDWYDAQMPSNIYSTIFTNVGTLTNQGIEFAIGYDVIRNKELKWHLDGGFSYNENKLVSLANSSYRANHITYNPLSSPANGQTTYILEEGKPIGTYYGLKYRGFNSAGKWVFEDRDEDGAYSDKDYTYLGNGLPKWYFNLASTLTWKDFDFSFQLRGAAGFKVLNTKRIYYENSVSLPFNLLKSALGRPLNDAATFSDYYLEKGNYLKLDNITVGYTFDLSQLKYVSNARIYATATNLLTITGYTGVDPEVGTGLTPGFDDSGYYPRSTTLMLGLNIKF